MTVLAQAGLRLPDGTILENSPLAGLVVLVETALIVIGLIVVVGLVFHFRDRRVDWNERRQLLLSRPWGWRESVKLLLGLFILQLLIVTTFRLVNQLVHITPDDTTLFIIQTVSFDWLGVALIGLLLVRHDWDWKSSFGFTSRQRGRSLVFAGLAFLAVMPFFWFYSTIYMFGLRWVGLDPTLQPVAVTITGQESLAIRVYLIFVAVILAPLFEELMFRGLLLPALAKRIGVGWSIMVVSALFGAIHLHLPSMFPLSLLAVAFSLAYLYSGNLLVPIVMHGLFNAFNLAVLTALR